MLRLPCLESCELRRRALALLQAASDTDRLTCHPRRIIGGKKDGNTRDVIRLAEPTERRIRGELLANRILKAFDLLEARRAGDAGKNGVDADLAGTKLAGSNFGDGIHRSFGSRVDGRCWSRIRAYPS